MSLEFSNVIVMYNIRMKNQIETSKQLNILLSIKENRVILSLSVVLILGAFYWYELRPTMVRNACAEDAVQYARENTRDPDNIELTESELKRAKDTASQSAAYDNVLHSDMKFVDGKITFSSSSRKSTKDFEDWILEATEKMLQDVQWSARENRKKVAETEYEKCMFKHGLENNL